jgi:glycosyltransferase involved in cell wall biosynthesis
MFGLRGLRRLSGYLYLLSLFGYLWQKRRDYDLIHVHLLGYAAWPAVVMGRRLGKKTLIKIANSGPHSDLLRMRHNDMLPGQRQMLPVALSADCLVALSPEIVAELLAAGVPRERIVVIPNGVELSQPPRCDYRLHGAVTVVYVGRLHPSKGLHVLLPAFEQAARQRPDLHWRLWLVGDGPLRPELEAQARQLGLAQAVTFWGQVDDVSECLARADLFVLPSLSEGLSNALLEAMSAGLPCIASRIGGNTTLIQDGETGLLIVPDAQAELTQALTRLAGSEPLRQKLGQQARQKVAAEYSLACVAQRYGELYDRLLNHPNP